MKVYLDTNAIFGFFKNYLVSKKYFMPWKIWFLKKHANKIDAYTSNLAISEAIAELTKFFERQKIQMKEEDVFRGINTFIKESGIKILNNFEVSEDIIVFSAHKIDVKDGLHLEISKRNNMVLVTDDQELKEKGKYFYSKIMSFYEFAKKINGSTQNRTGLSAL